MSRSIAEKMYLKPGMRAYVAGAPGSFLSTIKAPDLAISKVQDGEFDYIHLFVRDQTAMVKHFGGLKSHLAQGGALWVSWPKGRQCGTDLNLHEVIRIGYEHGLVESTCVSIDDTWSALRFTHPKPGKAYANSHAELVMGGSD